MARLAFYTFTILEEAHSHPQVKGFVDRLSFVFESAENTEGYIDRAGSRYLENQDAKWGDPSASPRFTFEQRNARQVDSSGDEPKNTAASDEYEAATLSIWDDLESVFSFAYSGRHAEALKKRGEWVTEAAWPSYVAWWIEDGQYPTREDACERLEHLHNEGSTPHAFDFKTPFDSEGLPWQMDRSKIKARSVGVKTFDEDNPTGL